MAAIKVTGFGGLRPSADPRLLQDTAAQTAQDLHMRFEDFRPAKSDVTVASSGVSNPKTIYRFNRVSGGAFNSNPATGWTVRAGDVNFVKGQINDDSNERTYYTGDGAPKATDLTGTVRTLGVPAASSAPTVTLNVVDEFTYEEYAKLVRQHVVALRETVTKNLTTLWYGSTSTFGLVARNNYYGMEEVDSDVVKAFPGNTDGTNHKLNNSDEFSWVLDPTIDSFWYGVAPPSVWLAVPLTIYGRAQYLSSITDRTEINSITHPITGAPLIDSTLETNFVGEISVLFDPTDSKVVDARQKLTAIAEQFSELLNNSHAAAQKAAVDDFYASSSVAATLSSARTNLATSIAGLLASIKPYYTANVVSPP